MRRPGERGATGDHGQMGQEGQQGEVGPIGHDGIRGRDAFTRRQTAVIALFILLAFVLLAYRAEHNATNIRENTRRINQFVEETCNTHPEFAPRTCASKIDTD